MFESFFAALRKDGPIAADVHVSSTGGGAKRKAKPFKAIIGQDTKLPVTKPTAAALAEDPDLGGAPVGKVGARNSAADLALIQTIHDTCASLGATCGSADCDEDEGAEKSAAWSIPFKIAKADADQQLIFGWASVVEKDGALIIDKQDDVIAPADLEKGAYDFVLHSRDHGVMHAATGTGRLVESMMFTKEKQDALGIDLGKVGWWVGFRVDDPDVWAAHKAGKLPEFSIGGSGKRTEV